MSKCDFCGRNSELTKLVSDGVGLITCYGGCQYQVHQRKLETDRLMYGVSFEKDGKRIDPRDVYINPKPVHWTKLIEDLNHLGCGRHTLTGHYPEAIKNAMRYIVEAQNPIPMFLTCPSCMVQHIDEDEWATKPHKTHQCQTCGHEWRPCNIPTVGVEKI